MSDAAGYCVKQEHSWARSLITCNTRGGCIECSKVDFLITISDSLCYPIYFGGSFMRLLGFGSFLFLLMFSFSPNLLAAESMSRIESKRLCGVRSVRKIYRAAKFQLSLYPKSYQRRIGDKFLHCTICCELTKKCNLSYAVLSGLLKEFLDIFTAGDASWEDLWANDVGATFGLQGRTCTTSCKDYFN